MYHGVGPGQPRLTGKGPGEGAHRSTGMHFGGGGGREVGVWMKECGKHACGPGIGVSAAPDGSLPAAASQFAGSPFRPPCWASRNAVREAAPVMKEMLSSTREGQTNAMLDSSLGALVFSVQLKWTRSAGLWGT